MARRPRLELPGVPLHVIQRGNNRAACFINDADRRLYLRCLAKASVLRACAVHAYVLMPNHVHLIVTPNEVGAVAEMMQDVGRRYVRIFNEIHRRTGTLWEGRYKSSLIDSDAYMLICHRYVELNPVRARIVNDAADYCWSSHRHYAFGERNSLITKHRLFDSLGETESARRAAFRSLFCQSIDSGSIERIRLHVNKGWALGSDSFLDGI